MTTPDEKDNQSYQISLPLDESQHLQKLRETEKQKRLLVILVSIVGFLVVACLIGIGIAAAQWSRLNAHPQVLWRHKVGGTIASAPFISNGVVYFGTLGDSPAFFAVDRATGQELWRTPTSDLVFDWVSTVANGMVFLTTDDGYFLALDADTGKEQWQFGPEQRQENLPDDPECLWCALKFRPPTIANGIIYVASHDDYIYALDASSGTEKWRFDTGSLVWGAPIIEDGLLYAGCNNGRIYILDAKTGIEQQQFNFLGDINSIKVEGNMLYIATELDLIAKNRHTGVEQWHKITSIMDGFSRQLHMDDERLYLLSMSRMTAIDKSTGSFDWKSNKFHGSVFSEPAIAEGVVVVGDADSYLYVLDAGTGKLIRRYNMVLHDPTSKMSYGAEFIFDPIVVDNVVYFGWYDYLYAMQMPE
ncbi:MAG: hypothetical protein DWQ04_22795 [Chloroflexi bacterium]|nr:MAG: hypothetical protein DWQ04_22795 [Chloroflexota bacterium]